MQGDCPGPLLPLPIPLLHEASDRLHVLGSPHSLWRHNTSSALQGLHSLPSSRLGGELCDDEEVTQNRSQRRCPLDLATAPPPTPSFYNSPNLPTHLLVVLAHADMPPAPPNSRAFPSPLQETLHPQAPTHPPNMAPPLHFLSLRISHLGI